jgi:alpha-beta hydrolase superfamily lysophospholipase
MALAAAPARALPSELSGLEPFLAQAESRYSDIRPDSEKHVVWADASRKQRTRYSVVYVHGFSASRQEVAPLCDIVARQLGANLYYARLPGHGRSEDAMAEGALEDYLEDGEQAVAIGHLLGERVILMGTSTGATLATWLAAHDESGRIAALVLISPNFAMQQGGAGLLLWPGGMWLGRLVIGDYRSFATHTELHALHWTERYPIEALRPMLQLVREVERLNVSALEQPLLVLYSPEDRVVKPAAITKRFAQWGAKNKRLIALSSEDPDRHVLAGAALSPGTTQAVADTIVGFLRGLPP